MILLRGMFNAISDESTQNLCCIFLGSKMEFFRTLQATQIHRQRNFFYMPGNSRELKKIFGNSKISNTGSYSPVTK